MIIIKVIGRGKSTGAKAPVVAPLIIAAALVLFFPSSLKASEPEAEISFESGTIEYDGSNSFVKREVRNLQEREINFKAQTRFGFPVDRDYNILQKVRDELKDLSLYHDISHYSEEKKDKSPLFSEIEVLEEHYLINGDEVFIVRQSLPPFNDVKMSYSIRERGELLLFTAKNIETIRFGFIPMIRSEKLYAVFAMELHDEKLDCYAVGVADTGGFFIFKRAIQRAFDSRIMTIMEWFHEILSELPFVLRD